MKTKNLKQIVKVRLRSLANGHRRPVLEIYWNKKRTYEILKDITLLPDGKDNREINKERMMLINSIRNKREEEVLSGRYDLIPSHRKEIYFVDYFESIVKRRKEINVDADSWYSTLKHIKIFLGNTNPKLKDMTESRIEEIRDYLLYEAVRPDNIRISNNSAHHYFNRILHCFKIAYKEKFLLNNPAENIPYIKLIPVKREYLTAEEVKQLVNTDCRYPVMKRAFLFGVVTGLRWSDIVNLTWGNIDITPEGWMLKFVTRKTKEPNFLPLSDQAKELLGQRGEPNQRPFQGLKYSAYFNVALSKWVLAAGITNKHITFHCSRHTFATLLLDNDTPIQVLQKLLGHSDIKTTLVYGKIIDHQKISAVNNLPNFLR